MLFGVASGGGASGGGAGGDGHERLGGVSPGGGEDAPAEATCYSYTVTVPLHAHRHLSTSASVTDEDDDGKAKDHPSAGTDGRRGGDKDGDGDGDGEGGGEGEGEAEGGGVGGDESEGMLKHLVLTEVPELCAQQAMAEQLMACDVAVLVFDPSSQRSLDYVLVSDGGRVGQWDEGSEPPPPPPPGPPPPPPPPPPPSHTSARPTGNPDGRVAAPASEIRR